MTARLRNQMRILQQGHIITQSFNQYLSTQDESGFVDPTNTRVMGIAVQLLARKPSGSRSGAFHPSGIHRCPREQVFSYLGVPSNERVNPGLQHVFNDGHWRHIRWQLALLQAGLLTDVEVGIRDKSLNLAGHLDGEYHDKYTFELKGVHPMQFQNYVREPKPEHLDQVELYFVMTGYDLGVLIAEDKGSNGWHEIVVRPEPNRRKRLLGLVNFLNDCLANRILPQPLDECRARKGSTYRDCQFAYHCLRSTFESAEAASKETTIDAALRVTVDIGKPVRVRKSST